MQIASRVSAGIRGLGLKVPEPVTRASQVLERFDDASDPEVVTTTARSWVDLTAGREALVALETVVQQDLETLRSAQSAASAGDEGLAADVVTERLELVDLLAAEELPANIAWIRAITERLVAARLSAIESANAELKEKVGEKARQIRVQYADVNERRPGRSVEAARRPGASHHRGLGARAASPRSWTYRSPSQVVSQPRPRGHPPTSGGQKGCWPKESRVAKLGATSLDCHPQISDTVNQVYGSTQVFRTRRHSRHHW